MTFSEHISNLISSTQYGSREDAYNSVRAWHSQAQVLYVSDAEMYNECLEKIYEYDKKISSRFSRKTIFEYVNKKIPRLKLSGDFEVEPHKFFETFFSTNPKDFIITAPISGVRLDGGIRDFSLPPYKFGYLSDLKFPIANENGMFISVVIRNVYDKNIAISKAEGAFLDFARLVVFISGKLDRSILISTGLPLMPSYTHEFMYVRTSSYQITDDQGNLESASISNNNLEKIPINNNFFSSNETLNKLWELNDKRINGPKLNDIDSRVINSALALGESALTADKKNSIIYTCMSLEILFSYDQGGLFQRSIGEKLSDLFTFIVARDKETRLKTGKVVKKVYGMRSAIVHGGDKELTDENLLVNFLMRAAISEILNAEKFKGVSNIARLYEMLKEAQNSY